MFTAQNPEMQPLAILYNYILASVLAALNRFSMFITARHDLLGVVWHIKFLNLETEQQN